MKHFYGVSLLAAVCLAACTPENEFIRSNGRMGPLSYSAGIADDSNTSVAHGVSGVVDTLVRCDDALSFVFTVVDMNVTNGSNQSV